MRAETRKPVENVFWEEGKAPAGNYQVYVHHYKKHQKRKSKDPTKFQVIVTPGGEPLEYSGELSSGDPIMLVAEFNLPSPEEREARKRELEAEIEAASRAFNDQSTEEKVEASADADSLLETLEDEVEPEMNVGEDVEVQDDSSDKLPSAPDLDALSED